MIIDAHNHTVSAGRRELAAGDTGNAPDVGGWHFFARR
jgi:hypothetical protein